MRGLLPSLLAATLIPEVCRDAPAAHKPPRAALFALELPRQQEVVGSRPTHSCSLGGLGKGERCALVTLDPHRASGDQMTPRRSWRGERESSTLRADA